MLQQIHIDGGDVQKFVKLSKDKTTNEVVRRGLLEKIFAGIGPNQIPNSP